ncbi:hypothetical protein KIW84_052830 [Lathyrus oleraceus]|uniref:Uncharacterized protein n=1 Tax=Pisum sativum TaxID=3888 RepID=A0A9D5AFS2_PEA|nr:hypothetical protein KIW84_052830 [Pisum sativum]
MNVNLYSVGNSRQYDTTVRNKTSQQKNEDQKIPYHKKEWMANFLRCLLRKKKAKNMLNDMRILYKKDGILLTNKEYIENEILGLYGNLMGKENDNMEGIDVVDMREGPQLSNEKRWVLETPVIETEI